MNINTFLFVLLIILFFLIGAIPFAYIVTKIFSGKDIRNVGSGNPGATNVVRALNIKYGVIVLLLDMAKGFIPVYTVLNNLAPNYVSALAFMIVIGHNYSPFLGFRGGKGVASSVGIFLVLAPIPTVIVSMIFLIITKVFKYVSFGSVMASVSYPFIAYFLGYRQYILLAVVLGGMIVFRHRANLIRLWQGNEKRSV